MTAYALLTYSVRDATAGIPIVRWIGNQRNDRGGFISTQVALGFIPDSRNVSVYRHTIDINTLKITEIGELSYLFLNV